MIMAFENGDGGDYCIGGCADRGELTISRLTGFLVFVSKTSLRQYRPIVDSYKDS